MNAPIKVQSLCILNHVATPVGNINFNADIISNDAATSLVTGYG